MKHNQMGRRDFLKTTAALGVTTALPHYLMAAGPKAPAKPNIILIMADV